MARGTCRGQVIARYGPCFSIMGFCPDVKQYYMIVIINQCYNRQLLDYICSILLADESISGFLVIDQSQVFVVLNRIYDYNHQCYIDGFLV